MLACRVRAAYFLVEGMGSPFKRRLADDSYRIVLDRWEPMQTCRASGFFLESRAPPGRGHGRVCENQFSPTLLRVRVDRACRIGADHRESAKRSHCNGV